MAGDSSRGSFERLKQWVMDAGLCTGCGACADTCPYLNSLGHKVVAVHDCTIDTGHCIAACPRAAPPAIAPSAVAGPVTTDRVLSAHYARAARSIDREGAQNGGVVTALLAWGLETGRLSGVLGVGGILWDPTYAVVRSADAVRKMSGSKFSVFPLLAKTHRIPDFSRCAVVVLPCQADALRRLTSADVPKPIATPLVIGLKCSGALDFRQLQKRLHRYRHAGQSIRLQRVFPAGDFDAFVGDDRDRKIECLNSEEMKPPACRTCTDLLAEASDLMVGADDRVPDRNVVLAWTEYGQAYWDQAVRAGVLETSPLCQDDLHKLQDEAAVKQTKALAAIATLREKGLDAPYVRVESDAL